MPRKNALTLSLLLIVAVPILLLPAGSVSADEDQRGAVKLLTTVPIPTSLVPLRAFDISWLDPNSQLYYLGDRSNKSVDVVDARTNIFLRHITGGFKGVVFKAGPGGVGQVADNDKSGPNGVVVSGHFLFVTDAPSRVVTIDLRTDQIVLGGDVSTGGTDGNRADELAFDPQDRLLLVVNNADDPPFASLIKVNADGALTVNQNECSTSVHPPCRITFKNFGPNKDKTATNGAEQPVWEPKTRRFYISIPEVNGVTSDGAVAKINPHTGAVEATFPVEFCQPAGLTVGPNQDLLLGCSVVFDTAGNAWDSKNPNSIAAPTQIIMDANTGTIDASVAGVGGSDEVWFNPGDRRYYTASRNNPTGPVLGVIDAESQTLVQIVPTVNTAGKITDPPFPAGTSHSVAVDPRNNHALVPLPANNVFPNCSNGCIAVFGTPRGDHDED